MKTTQTTRKGLALLGALSRWGEWTAEEHAELGRTLSLIARHAKTAERLGETMGCAFHSSEWVAEHQNELDAQDDQVTARLLALAEKLPSNITLELGRGYIGNQTVLIITDKHGTPREYCVGDY